MSASYPIRQSPSPEPDHPQARAFASSTEAASSLERSYGQLRAQVAHLRQEREVTNRDPAKSLEENWRIRERQRRILEGLPCGVLVMEAGSAAAILNPEGERLLAARTVVNALPLSDVLRWARETGEKREVLVSAVPPQRWLAVRHAWLEPGTPSGSVYILRDLSEAKKLQREREQMGRQQALVEMSALLDTSATGKNVVLLVEKARHAPGRELVRPILSDGGGLRVLTLNRSIEEELNRAFSPRPAQTPNSGLQASLVRRILERWGQLAAEHAAQNGSRIVVFHPGAFSLALATRTLPAKSCGAFSVGNPSHGSGAVTGYGALSLD